MVSPYTIHLPKELDTLLDNVMQVTGVSSKTILLDWLQHPVPTIQSITLDTVQN